MIQLFLTILLLVILAIIINTKESFNQEGCSSNILNAINDYIGDGGDNKIPCIKLITTNIKDKSGYIVINEKNENISRIINLPKSGISVEEEEDNNGTYYINLTKDNSDIEIGKTYLITLNIINEQKNSFHVYDTIEITFREVNLSGDDLNTKCKTTKDRLIDSLKTKNIVFHL
jgi:hypothetical protein